MNWRNSILAASIGLAMSGAASAGVVDVNVGYADGLRGVGFFPSPWSGDPTVDLFAGTTAPGPDEGAIRVRNTSASPVTIDSLVVTLNPGTGPIPINLWTGFLPFTLAPGHNAIFTATANFNFDTSDSPFTDNAHNCVTSPTPSPNCGINAPKVDLTIDGVTTTYHDTGHVLDTEGFDFATVGNESFAWRLIGTVGGPSGGPGVPEPATLSLIGIALAGLGLRRRRAS